MRDPTTRARERAKGSRRRAKARDSIAHREVQPALTIEADMDGTRGTASLGSGTNAADGSGAGTE